MSTELVRTEPQITAVSLEEKKEWAQLLASASLLPRQYQQNPGNLLFAIEYADALGVKPIHAINSIHVIEGKPSASADLIASLVRRAGHKLRVSGDDTYALAQLIRADDPDFTYEARWDIGKARAAGLLGKGVWKSYPGAMLRSRAITEVARMGASDALYGVIYTPEELGAEVSEQGEVVHTVTRVQQQPAERTSGADRIRAVAQPAAAPQNQPTPRETQAETSLAEGEAGSNPASEPPASAAPTDNGPTQAQLRKMGALMREADLTERQAALGYVAAVIGRTVDSRNDLTRSEAAKVIDHLERGIEPGDLPEPPVDDVVDAEIVTPDGDLWGAIAALAQELGMSRDDLVADFKARMGFIPDEATDDELAHYLDLLRTKGVAA